MKDTERIIQNACRNADYSDKSAHALCLIAEQLRIANLLKAKELGMEIPNNLIIGPLVDGSDAVQILRDTESLRLNMGYHIPRD